MNVAIFLITPILKNTCQQLFLYYRILKKKFLKKERMANRNSEKSEISEISEKLFGIFLFTSFRFFPTGKIQNSDLKISEKNFRNFRGFRVFSLAILKSNFLSKNKKIGNAIFEYIHQPWLFHSYYKTI